MLRTVRQAYRFGLDATPAQRRAMASHCGAQRFAYNWGLAWVKANIAQREAERTYGLFEDALTPLVRWNAYELRRVWNKTKSEVAPWWGENSKEAYSSGLANLTAALVNWSDSRSGKRKGVPVRFPKFKGRKADLSCRFTTGAIRVEADRHHVTLPRIGAIRTHESTRKLARRLETGTARILSATVSYRRGRWHVSLTVEAKRSDSGPAKPDASVGVDLGVKCLAVMSTGEAIPNPSHLERYLKRLRRASRRASRRIGPDSRTRQAPSGRWKRANADRNRILHRVANARVDGLHKLSTGLASTYGTVVIEDLHVAGMIRNRALSRRIAGVGMGEIRRQLSYKTAWRGGQLVVADRWFASSKTCSSCETVKTKLSLRVRVFECDNCGLRVDRDLNAAINLAHLVQRASDPGTGSGSETRPIRKSGKRTRRPCETSHRAGSGHGTVNPASTYVEVRRGPFIGNDGLRIDEYKS